MSSKTVKLPNHALSVQQIDLTKQQKEIVAAREADEKALAQIRKKAVELQKKYNARFEIFDLLGKRYKARYDKLRASSQEDVTNLKTMNQKKIPFVDPNSPYRPLPFVKWAAGELEKQDKVPKFNLSEQKKIADELQHKYNPWWNWSKDEKKRAKLKSNSGDFQKLNKLKNEYWNYPPPVEHNPWPFVTGALDEEKKLKLTPTEKQIAKKFIGRFGNQLLTDTSYKMVTTLDFTEYSTDFKKLLSELDELNKKSGYWTSPPSKDDYKIVTYFLKKYRQQKSKSPTPSPSGQATTATPSPQSPQSPQSPPSPASSPQSKQNKTKQAMI